MEDGKWKMENVSFIYKIPSNKSVAKQRNP